MTKTPAQIVKEKFGEKSKLVEALKPFLGEDLWVARTNDEKGIDHVSNAKLLRLHAIFSAVKEKFGTREKLIDAIVAAAAKPKDQGFRARLADWPVPRLYDTWQSLTARAKKAEAKVAKAARLAKLRAEKKAAK